MGYDRSCCTTKDPCGVDEGDCDKDSHCAGELVCGSNNCGSRFPSGADCCKQSKHADHTGNPKCKPDTLENYDRSCCKTKAPCGVDEGDCDKDSHCAGDLVCGTNNCGSRFPSGADCCMQSKR